MPSPSLFVDLYFITQAIGLVGFVVMAGSFQCNNRTHLLYWQVLAMALLGSHLYLLGAVTGAAMMAILLLRNIVFSHLVGWPQRGILCISNLYRDSWNTILGRLVQHLCYPWLARRHVWLLAD